MRKNAIHHTDLLYVTAQAGNDTLLTLTLSGASGMSDVMRRVRCETPDADGLVTVSIRNRTQGWSLEQRMVLKPQSVHAAVTSAGEYPRLFA